MQTADLESNAGPATARRGLSFELFGVICTSVVLLGLVYFTLSGPSHPSPNAAPVRGEMLR